MPITQERMIAVLDALQDCIETIQLTRETLADIANEALASQNLRRGIDQVYNIASSLRAPDYAHYLLGKEKGHFDANMRRNEMNARRMARKRGDDMLYTSLGPPRKHTSPITGLSNGSPSAAEQRASARAYMRAQATPPIILPAEAELPPDMVTTAHDIEAVKDQIREEEIAKLRAKLAGRDDKDERVAKAEEALEAEEAQRAKGRSLTRSDGVEVSVPPDGEAVGDPGSPLLGNVVDKPA